MASPTPPPGSKPPTAANDAGRARATSSATALEGPLALQPSPDGPVALASSTQCDFSSCAFVRLLVAEFRAGRDAIVRDGIAKALAIPGDVNDGELTVADSPDLGASAIVDAYIAALEFAAAQSFSAIQTQQLLLLLVDTLDLIPSYAPRFGDDAGGLASSGTEAESAPSGSPASASPASVPGVHPLNTVLYHFSRKLARLCAATEMLVDERSVVVEVRNEEHVDPAAQAAYEAKLAKAKKGQTVEPPPKTTVKVTEEKEVFDRKTIVVGPYFDPSDVARVVEWFNASVFQHWALFQIVLTRPRDIVEERATLFLDHVPTFLDPLSAAVPLADYDEAQARLAVETEAETAIGDTISAADAEWATLMADASENAAAVTARDERARQEDNAAAMSSNEFQHTQHVLDGAIKAATQKKITQSGILARIERAEAAAAHGIPPPKAADATGPGSPTGANPPAAAAAKGKK